jgi:hypothetical protein
VNPEDDGLFDDDIDDMNEGEYEITIEPRDEALESAGIDRETFETALMAALENHEEFAASFEGNEEDFPDLEDIPLQIEGASYRLGDLADIEVNNISEETD